jgi:DNA polymerase III subunit delta
MAEISYQQLASHLKGLDPPAGGGPPVYLIYGEDLLVASVFDEVLRHFLPAPQDSLNYEPFDGASSDIGEVLAAVNTFALMPGTKVVALKDARIFHTKEDASRLLEQAHTAHTDGDMAKAARCFLSALGQLGQSLADMAGPGRRGNLPAGFAPGEDEGWIDALLAHCAANHRAVPAAADTAGMLERAIAKGFPRGNHLLITTDAVDRRRSLYKSLGAEGVIIDCSVPKGERKADRDVQDAVLAEHMQSILAPRGKSMNRPAFQALCEMTGFNLGTFAHNLEILADYVGGRADITAEDVQAALTRSKKDPIYEFTNAVADRDRDRAFFFLRSLLEGGMHPLQALSAIVNQVRKLLVAKGFTQSPSGAVWRRGCSYAQFQKNVMPAVVQHDRELLALLEGWETDLAEPPAEGAKKKKAKANPATDLVLAKNPANAFPVYQLIKKSDEFSREELLRAIERLSQTDSQLKSSALDARLILERLIRQICEK